MDAKSLDDAWFQTLFRMLEEGSVFKIDRGSFAGQKRLEFDYVTIKVEHPGTLPLLPQIEPHHNIPNPVADDYLDDYLPYLMTGEIGEGESYTYGQRMTKVSIDPRWVDGYSDDEYKEILIQDNEAWDVIDKSTDVFTDHGIKFMYEFLNQVDLLIWTYKNKGHRNNQMVLQVAQPDDMLLKDPPCLRHIDTRIQDGKLHFYPYFRSWDLWGGFPANLGGIQLLKEYVAAEIGVEDGEIIASSKGLHIYDYSFDLAKCLRMRDDMKLKGE
ncbi:MAG: thymidylate synthase [Candidatus Heimdallarchaeaceae archaeon]